MTIRDKPTSVYWLDNSLYLNLTNQCSNNCWFCFRNYKQGVGGFNLKLTKEPDASEVISELEQIQLATRWSEVVFCGIGEPTARLDILLEIARWIKKHHPSLPIRLDTNGQGYLLNKDKDVATELKTAGVSKVSVSLNGYNAETYDENCKPRFEGSFETVLEFVQKAKAVALDVEVSAVRIPEVDIQRLKAVADGLGVPFRVRDYIPCFW